MHPANKIENVKRRANTARKGGVTCPASRHVHMLAGIILRRGEDVGAFTAEEVAGSMLSVVASLWEERSKTASSGDEKAE